MNAISRKHAGGELTCDVTVRIRKGPGMFALDFHNSGKPIRTESILEASK